MFKLFKDRIRSKIIQKRANIRKGKQKNQVRFLCYIPIEIQRESSILYSIVLFNNKNIY